MDRCYIYYMDSIKQAKKKHFSFRLNQEIQILRNYSYITIIKNDMFHNIYIKNLILIIHPNYPFCPVEIKIYKNKQYIYFLDFLNKIYYLLKSRLYNYTLYNFNITNCIQSLKSDKKTFLILICTRIQTIIHKIHQLFIIIILQKKFESLGIHNLTYDLSQYIFKS